MSSADDFIDAGRATTINADEAAVRPVSYTHLDVYKRQSIF